MVYASLYIPGFNTVIYNFVPTVQIYFNHLWRLSRFFPLIFETQPAHCRQTTIRSNPPLSIRFHFFDSFKAKHASAYTSSQKSLVFVMHCCTILASLSMFRNIFLYFVKTEKHIAFIPLTKHYLLFLLQRHKTCARSRFTSDDQSKKFESPRCLIFDQLWLVISVTAKDFMPELYCAIFLRNRNDYDFTVIDLLVYSTLTVASY